MQIEKIERILIYAFIILALILGLSWWYLDISGFIGEKANYCKPGYALTEMCHKPSSPLELGVMSFYDLFFPAGLYILVIAQLCLRIFKIYVKK